LDGHRIRGEAFILNRIVNSAVPGLALSGKEGVRFEKREMPIAAALPNGSISKKA
jgi:hypothetical protein